MSIFYFVWISVNSALPPISTPILPVSHFVDLVVVASAVLGRPVDDVEEVLSNDGI